MQLRLRFITWFQDYPLDVWVLGLGSFINITGLSLLWPINALYIHTRLGQPMTVAGLVLMLYSGAGFIGSFVSGWLYDRIGIIPVLMVGLGASSVLICVPAFQHSFPMYIAVMGLFGMTCAMPFPALTTMAGQAWPGGGRRPFNFIYVTNNLGVAVGTALGGVLAQISFSTVFIGISAAYLIFLVLVLTVFRSRFGQYRATAKGDNSVVNGPSGVEVSSQVSRDDMGLLHSERDRLKAQSPPHPDRLPLHMLPPVPWVAILVLLSGFVLSWTVYVQWQSTISVYMQQLGFPLTSYSVLWTLNGLLIFAAQPLISWGTRHVRELPQQMLTGVLLYIVSFGILAVTHLYYGFVLAMIVTTFGEMFVWPAIPAAIAQMAPPHRAGLLQGLAGSCATLGRMIGPVIGGLLFDHATEHIALIAYCGLLFLPLVLFLVYGRLDRAADHPTRLSM